MPDTDAPEEVRQILQGRTMFRFVENGYRQKTYTPV